MPGDKFCNIDRMADITCPVFLVHGTNDEVVPFWNGQELYLGVSEEFRYRPFWVQGEYFKAKERASRMEHCSYRHSDFY